MSDPRKPVVRYGTDKSQQATSIAYKHLLRATENGASELGTSGASFVVLGLGIWATELAEINPMAASKMLAALSVIYDPKSKPQAKERAERHRRASVEKIFSAVDMALTETEGRA